MAPRLSVRRRDRRGARRGDGRALSLPARDRPERRAPARARGRRSGRGLRRRRARRAGAALRGRPRRPGRATSRRSRMPRAELLDDADALARARAGAERARASSPGTRRRAPISSSTRAACARARFDDVIGASSTSSSRSSADLIAECDAADARTTRPTRRGRRALRRLSRPRRDRHGAPRRASRQLRLHDSNEEAAEEYEARVQPRRAAAAAPVRPPDRGSLRRSRRWTCTTARS